MPRSHRPTVIDGFTSIQAVKRSSSRNPHDKDAPEQAPAPAEPKQRASVKARIGHTAMPRKHEIVCYECGYAFTLQGRVDKTYCPKCRTELQRIDHTLNAQWSGSVKTIGTVTVPEGIALRGGNITACDVVLCGDAKGVTIKASRRIEFGTGGLLDPRHVTCRDILVRPDSRVSFPDGMPCRHLDVRGDLHGCIEQAETVRVRAGGRVRGRIVTAHLIVEDGAALDAELDVRQAVGSDRTATGKEDGAGAKAHDASPHKAA